MKKTISKAGVNLIKSFEGFLKYGTNEGDGTITIGYGTTKYDEGTLGITIYEGMETTKEEASKWLALTMTKKYLPAVLKYNDKYKFTQNEIDALTSFCYNAGSGSLANLLENGNASRKTIIEKWPNTNVLPGSQFEVGLRRRRNSEVALFKGDINSDLKRIGVTKENLGKPGIEGGSVSAASDSNSSSSGSLSASPERLYSSDNFKYIKAIEDTTEQVAKRNEALKSTLEQKAEERSSRFGAFIVDLIYDTVAVELAKLNPSVTVESKTMVSGSTSSSTLPVVSIFVEAPYFEVEIAGVKFGGYHNNKIPNYVKSLSVTKTNGSINEYSIQLIHQISPGDNPNYIDELFSKVGYDIISIRYGNANTGDIFSDNNALITDIAENFDFASCNITYTISATSIAVSTGGTKRNFPALNGKASDEIRRLLWHDKTSDLSTVFPGMKNQIEVEQAGLIPTDDSPIHLGVVRNITTVGYVAMLVAHMQNSSTMRSELSDSQYTFVIEDSASGSRFRIKEITSNLNKVPFMYEVNVGYPDDNFVLEFNVNTNFSWSVAYESSKKIKRYDYEIDALGNLEAQNIPAYYKDDNDTVGSRTLWTSLTRYPIDATLTVRGLLQDSLLMQYIKVNQYMYGAKRITSGVYIVTEQSDSIGSGVYSTTLKLMRISGDDEYINLDGRIIT